MVAGNIAARRGSDRIAGENLIAGKKCRGWSESWATVSQGNVLVGNIVA
jgi:hypothetical protein